jgi:hypothetical protein
VPEIDALAELIADAQRMPTAMLPRPRRPEPSPSPRPSIDLTTGMAIPAAAASLVDGYGDYGS